MHCSLCRLVSLVRLVTRSVLAVKRAAMIAAWRDRIAAVADVGLIQTAATMSAVVGNAAKIATVVLDCLVQ